MAVRKHRKGWRVDYYDEGAIRRRKHFRLKADAEVFQAEQQAKRNRANIGPAVPDRNITLAEFAQAWLAEREAMGIDASTRQRNEINLRLQIIPAFGKVRVREIDRLAVRDFLLKLLSTGVSRQGTAGPGTRTATTRALSRGTVGVIFHTLSAILTEAQEKRIITANPIRGLLRTLNRSGKDEASEDVEALTSEELRLFLTAAKVRQAEHYPLLAFMAWTGTRTGEAFAVRADKVDLGRRQVRIDKQISQVDGLKSTKTGRPRDVELGEAVAEILGELMMQRQVDRATSAAISQSGPGPYLFAPELPENPTGKMMRKVYRSATRALSRCLDAAGLPARYTLHSLRHTYASNLLSAGVPIVYVQRQLGHRNISETVNTYGRWLPIEAPGALDKFTASSAPDATLQTPPPESHGHQMDTKERIGQIEAA